MSVPALSDFDRAVRAEVYRAFAASGRAPAVGALAARLGSTEHHVLAALERLAAAQQLALKSDGGVWMANPFSAVPTPYPVETPAMTCYAACAWDAFGVPALLETDAVIRTRCAESGTPMEFGVSGGALTGDTGVIHLVTPIRDAWRDIGFT